MDRGAWLATVHRVTKSQTGLKLLSTQHSRCILTGFVIEKKETVYMYKTQRLAVHMSTIECMHH